MRTIPEPDDQPEDDPTSRIVDWKDNPADTLEAMDDLLEPYGLEVVLLNTDADYYRFRVERRPTAMVDLNAVAPEMLEALKYVSRAFAQIKINIPEVETAIAKAEGRT